MLARFVFFLFVSTPFLFAALSQEKIANKSYQIRVGKGNELKAESITGEKEPLPPLVQTKNGKPIAGVDYSEAIILNKIIASTKKREVKAKAKAVNYLALPKTYTNDIKESEAKTALASASDSVGKVATIEKLLVARCRTFKDYKISSDSRIKMLCRSKKGKEFMLFAKLEMNFDKKPELKAVPYMFESVNSVIRAVNKDKSALYNGINGSVNLATFVDKRALEKVSKAMAGTAGNEVPKMANDYISKKYASDSTVTQTDTSTITATTTPEPNIADYGFSLLAKVIGSGIKAGADQLYQDLGYIYFIPKDSIIDAEIVYSVSTGNKE